MNNSYNSINNITKNSILELLLKFISDNAVNMLLDFSSTIDRKYFLQTIKHIDFLELDKIKNTSHISGRIILLTNSGKIEKLHFLSDKIDVIRHYKIMDFNKATSLNLIAFEFELKYFNILLYDFTVVMQLEYVENFIKTFFDNDRGEKPLFLLSNGHDINRIKKDIAYLKDSTVLTSRLAIFLYKVCTWNFNISSTKVGKIFALHYKRSKNYNDKKFDIKNAKGYVIHAMHDYKIQEERIRIAKYLLYNSANCNLYILSQATHIPVEQLQRL